MKKGFDANVSRARPRLRLGNLPVETAAAEEAPAAESVESIAERVAQEGLATLSEEVRTRATDRHEPVSAARALAEALEELPAEEPSGRLAPPVPVAGGEGEEERDPGPAMVDAGPREPERTAGPEVLAHADRRARLRDRLKAVRENPRPQPLPDTVAEAGAMAVERIASLQAELARARAQNLSLTQQLEASRRASERASDEARTRTEEARRLAAEMEERAGLLSELEKELEALEAERNEALLALQEARGAAELTERERAALLEQLAEKDRALEDSLTEEERLAAELELSREAAVGLERSVEALRAERDRLAHDVATLTRERGELLEARKALEAVHRALASAVR